MGSKCFKSHQGEAGSFHMGDTTVENQGTTTDLQETAITCSESHHHEAFRTSTTDDDENVRRLCSYNTFRTSTTDDDENVRRLWSYNSKSGGSYVCMTEDIVGPPYVVAATGESEALTDISFVVPPNSNRFQPMFELRFNKDDTCYAINASESGVTASEITDPPTATVFGVIEFWSPNTPYVALRSNQQQDGHNLFLSSNGAGNMKLKRWNNPVPESPFTTPEVDPALLFRVVRPGNHELVN